MRTSQKTCECPACGYRWSAFMGMAELLFDEKECCPCCPNCRELIEDGADY